LELGEELHALHEAAVNGHRVPGRQLELEPQPRLRRIGEAP
jgi:hypothetical protein